MADEEKREESVPQEEKPVAETPSVTDADLASAYDSDQQVQEKVETEPKEEPKEEVKPEPKEEVAEQVTEEPTDNAERSRLGRRIKNH